MKIQKTYRVAAEAVNMLQAWADSHGTTATATLEAAITAYTSGERDGAAAEVEALRAQVEDLTQRLEAAPSAVELEHLRSQVESLTRILEAEQRNVSALTDALQATQAVAALDRGAAPGTEIVRADGTKPTLWQRIRGRW